MKSIKYNKKLLTPVFSYPNKTYNIKQSSSVFRYCSKATSFGKILYAWSRGFNDSVNFPDSCDFHHIFSY